MDSIGRGSSKKHQDLEKGWAVIKPMEFHFYPSQASFFFLFFFGQAWASVCVKSMSLFPYIFPLKKIIFLMSLLLVTSTACKFCSASWKYPLNGGSQGCFGQMTFLQLHHAKNKPEMYTVLTWSRYVPKEQLRKFIQQKWWMNCGLNRFQAFTVGAKICSKEM